MIKSRIVVACDSFKGACTSLEAGNAVLRGILKRLPDADVTVLSVGDGGEGTAFALGSALGFKKQHFFVSDTHGDPVSAEFYSSSDNTTAIFDMASCSGIALAKAHRLDILHASTAGVGQMIRHLAELGKREIIVCLGRQRYFGRRCRSYIGAWGALFRLSRRAYYRSTLSEEPKINPLD